VTIEPLDCNLNEEEPPKQNKIVKTHKQIQMSQVHKPPNH